jgi:hypothetical protein
MTDSKIPPATGLEARRSRWSSAGVLLMVVADRCWRKRRFDLIGWVWHAELPLLFLRRFVCRFASLRTGVPVTLPTSAKHPSVADSIRMVDARPRSFRIRGDCTHSFATIGRCNGCSVVFPPRRGLLGQHAGSRQQSSHPDERREPPIQW